MKFVVAAAALQHYKTGQLLHKNQHNHVWLCVSFNTFHVNSSLCNHGSIPAAHPPCILLCCPQEEIVDETDNEPINARVLTMSLSPGMRRLLLASQQRQAQRMQGFMPASLAGVAAAAGPCGENCTALPNTTVTVVTTRASIEGSSSHAAAAVAAAAAGAARSTRASVEGSSSSQHAAAAAAGAGASSSIGGHAVPVQSGTVVALVQPKQ
jgi:hypothetical protein